MAECPLKPDTKALILELQEASHETKMITGDNALTAAFIGQELNFGNGRSLFAHDASGTSKITWYDIDDKFVKTTQSADEVEELAESSMLCINGDVLDKVIRFPQAAPTMRHVDIFSRTSPA